MRGVNLCNVCVVCCVSSGETCNVLTCKRLWLLSHEVSRMIHSNQRHLATLFITVAQQISATPHSSQLKYTLQIDPIQITPTHGRLYLGFALEDVAQSYAVYDWKKSSTGIVSKVLPNYMDPGSNKFLEKDCYNCMWQPLCILHFFYCTLVLHLYYKRRDSYSNRIHIV